MGGWITGGGATPDNITLDTNGAGGTLEIKPGGVSNTQISQPLDSASLAASASSGNFLTTNGTANSWGALPAQTLTWVDDFDGYLNWSNASGAYNTLAQSGSTVTLVDQDGGIGVVKMLANGHDSAIQGPIIPIASTTAKTFGFKFLYHGTAITLIIGLGDIVIGGTYPPANGIALDIVNAAVKSWVASSTKMNASITAPTADAWHDLRITYTSAAISVSIDGVVVATDSTAGDIPTVAMGVMVFTSSYASEYILLDRIYYVNTT